MEEIDQSAYASSLFPSSKDFEVNKEMLSVSSMLSSLSLSKVEVKKDVLCDLIKMMELSNLKSISVGELIENLAKVHFDGSCNIEKNDDYSSSNRVPNSSTRKSLSQQREAAWKWRQKNLKISSDNSNIMETSSDNASTNSSSNSSPEQIEFSFKTPQKIFNKYVDNNDTSSRQTAQSNNKSLDAQFGKTIFLPSPETVVEIPPVNTTKSSADSSLSAPSVPSVSTFQYSGAENIKILNTDTIKNAGGKSSKKKLSKPPSSLPNFPVNQNSSQPFVPPNPPPSQSTQDPNPFASIINNTATGSGISIGTGTGTGVGTGNGAGLQGTAPPPTSTLFSFPFGSKDPFPPPPASSFSSSVPSLFSYDKPVTFSASMFKDSDKRDKHTSTATTTSSTSTSTSTSSCAANTTTSSSSSSSSSSSNSNNNNSTANTPFETRSSAPASQARRVTRSAVRKMNASATTDSPISPSQPGGGTRALHVEPTDMDMDMDMDIEVEVKVDTKQLSSEGETPNSESAPSFQHIFSRRASDSTQTPAPAIPLFIPLFIPQSVPVPVHMSSVPLPANTFSSTSATNDFSASAQDTPAPVNFGFVAFQVGSAPPPASSAQKKKGSRLPTQGQGAKQKQSPLKQGGKPSVSLFGNDDSSNFNPFNQPPVVGTLTGDHGIELDRKNASNLFNQSLPIPVSNDETPIDGTDTNHVFGIGKDNYNGNGAATNSDWQKGTQDLAEILRKDGNRLYTDKNYEMAFDAFTQALNAAPDAWIERANVLGNRAAALMMMERLIEAINDCEAASKIDPHSPKLHGRRGRALMRLGRIQEANEAFLAVLSISRAEASEGEDVEKESSAKEQARAAMKKLALARVLRNRIESQVVLKEFKNVIKSADEMLSICPLAIDARTHKARALCQVHRYEESKEFTEALISGLHSTTRQFFQHSAAPAVTPSRESLSWCERSDTQVVVDTASVTQFMLCCGSELSQIYLCSLKNNKLAGSGWCADAIDKITLILKGLDYSINSTRSSSLAWSWVADELDRLSRLASGKIDADEKFRKKCFLNAKDAYTALLEIDSSNFIWNAIMYGNRAACNMRMGLFEDAVKDCHKSIANDSEYGRAYLRRARALKAMGEYSQAISDFKKYLGSTPRPVDSTEVEEEMMDAFKAKECVNSKSRSGSDRSSGDEPKDSSQSRRTHQSDKDFDNMYNRFSQQQSKEGETRGRNSTEGKGGANYAHNHSKGHSDKSASSSAKPTTAETKTADFTSQNMYARLGVSNMNITDKEIKVIYRKLALKYHPDKNKQEGAESVFKAVTEAYNILLDPVTRREHDVSVHTSSMRRRTANGNAYYTRYQSHQHHGSYF